MVDTMTRERWRRRGMERAAIGAANWGSAVEQDASRMVAPKVKNLSTVDAFAGSQSKKASLR